MRRYAPFRSFGGGFEGDGRGFQTSLHVTSRTVGVVKFSRAPGGLLAEPGYSTGSAYVGPWEVRRHIPTGSIVTSVGQVRVSLLNVATSPDRVGFTFYTEGNLPLKDIALFKKLAEGVDKLNEAIRPGSPRPQGTPDIDTFIDFTATFGGGKVLFEGVVRGDGFPNAEVFVLDAASQAAPLFDYRTKSNEAGPLWRLFGAHAGNRLGDFRREVNLKPDGSFGANAGGPPAVVQEI